MLHKAANTALRQIQKLRARFGPTGLIFIYHRVAEPQADPWNMAVSPKNFEAQMAVLRRYAVPRTMSDLARHVSKSRTPDRSVAVTFDDGYVDNLTHALPALQTHDIPATVFVISGATGRPDAFWWDALTRVFLETPHLPETLKLMTGDNPRTFELGASAALDVSSLAGHAAWRADLTAPKDGRQRVFLDVWAHILTLSATGQTQAATEILGWSGLSDTPVQSNYGRPMDREELLQLAASPLIEIGGHTLTHADLSRLTPNETLKELTRGRQALIDLTNQPIDSFAYPYGRYAEHSADQIRKAGFTAAGWSRPGLTVPTSNTLALPRLQIEDMDARSFEELLTGMLGAPVSQKKSL